MSRNTQPHSKARRAARCLQLQTLEQRHLLATFSPLPWVTDGEANSLRAAVIAANANNQNDTIHLTNGIYKLTKTNSFQLQENEAASGDLDFTEAGRTILIQGQGASSVIDGQLADRIIQVFPNVTVVLRDLVLRNSVALDDGLTGSTPETSFLARGGGLLALGSANVTLTNVLLTNAEARGSNDAVTPAAGGAIYVEGRLTVAQSTLIENQATAGAKSGFNGQGAEGGAIFAADGSIVHLSFTAVQSNRARGGEGGTAGAALGGGIRARGSLTLIDCTIADNHAIAALGVNGGSSSGGGVYSGGTTVITNGVIASNSAIAGVAGSFSGGQGGVASGGGLTAHGRLTVDGALFTHNVAIGGQGGLGNPSSDTVGGTGGSGGYAQGGGIEMLGIGTIRNARFFHNAVTGGIGGVGGSGQPRGPGAVGARGLGGAIFIGGGGSLTLTRSTISSNLAQGGTGGGGASGINSGLGGLGGEGAGGGLFAAANIAGGAAIVVYSSTFDANQAMGGKGGRGGGFSETGGASGVGGTGSGGGVHLVAGAKITFNTSTLHNNAAMGGEGGQGADSPVAPSTSGASAGNGVGGGVAVEGGTLSLRNTTLYANQARGGVGGMGGDSTGFPAGPGGSGGLGRGGAVFASAFGTAWVRNSTIAANAALGGGGGAPGGANGVSEGGGVLDAGAFHATSTIFANNLAGSHPDYSGVFDTSAFNMLKDGTGATNISHGINGNLIGLDPKLGPLASNGGITKTALLLGGSPAIDRGSNAVGLATDQRGLPRVSKGRADIGAVELQPPRVVLGGTIAYARDAAAIVLASAANVTDLDSANFSGGRLRVRITEGASTTNRLVIGGGFTVDSSNNVLLNGVSIGKRTANGFGTNELIISFNSKATPAVAQQLVRAIMFKTVAGTAGKRTVLFNLADGDGGFADTAIKTVQVS